jgi:3',5'-cyclic AMP phosphodiesterase CpdA
MAVRLAHLSDIHITTSPLGWRLRDYFNKRLPGYFNFRVMGRGRRFSNAETVLSDLVAEVEQRRPDHVVFSGDATAMGYAAEFARAASLLKVGDAEMLPGLAVPGNHDYYTVQSAAAGMFERYFAPWQQGERVDDAVYPFAQRVGHVWLIGVNSCTGNRWAWDAGGAVDVPQLDRLARLLDRMDGGPRILVTHYPIGLADGRKELFNRGLRNLGDLVKVAERGGVRLWLHGHRHGGYHLATSGHASFPAICVGSATQNHHWTYNEYTVEGDHLRAARRVYSPRDRCFVETSAFELTLAPLAVK